jgi:hypothetical protein
MAGLNIQKNLTQYLGDRNRDSRYASFDYCFNYFQEYRERGQVAALVEPAKLQESCLQLGFYLASWGMLRGSSQLLQRSVRSFVPVVEAIAAAPERMWTIDAGGYSEDAITMILEFARTLRRTLHKGASNILLTKIMLGTMGCVPAFDTNFKKGFKKGFGVAKFDRESLQKVGRFYRDNAAVIDAHREFTLDFDSGLQTQRRYTQAKVVDMIFFIEGKP